MQKNTEAVAALTRTSRKEPTVPVVKKMGKAIKKVWNVITNILVTVVVIIAIALVGVRLVGLNVFTVLSGSMLPTYQVGSLIYVKDIDYTEIEGCTPLAEGETAPAGAETFEYNGTTYLVDGTVLTFMLNEDTVATHRCVAVVPDEDDPTVLRFMTKGDNNESVDGSLVHYKNVIGTPIFSIPYLGYVANYIQNPPGTYIAISGGALLLLLVFLPDLFGGDDEPKQKKKRGKFEETR